MKISYWSPVHGQAGTTSNILVTALIAGMVYNKECLLTQTHFNFNNMEAPLIGSNSKNAKTTDYFRDIGLDSLIRNYKASKLKQESIEDCCISLPGTGIHLLPGTCKSNRDTFEDEMETIFINLIRTIEKHMGIVFIDLNSGNHPLSLKVIADSDLTVVNLSQNMGFIDYFFDTYYHLISSKTFYLFGNYDCNSKYNIYNIRRRYRKYITPQNSGAIPYNTMYHDAQCDGKIIEFIKENHQIRRSDHNGFFMVKSINAADKILKQAGIQ
ncbi:hypothetical protein I5677_07000 [Mobilitalea sibirica]|uniref:AAA domain-containing protein n=1 Tax=Mobilitalea sibirica TaxID=1462919 RepID=A0A8J7KWL8_9FIRM|nr:hypothetical protein [Mobilitalea sibirica]MBH1940632.1 hypothetical protein [Mobilitalea sibirica]